MASKIISLAHRMAEEVAGDYISHNIFGIGDGHLSTKRAEEIAQKVDIRTLRDNTYFALALNQADRKYRADGEIEKKLTRDFQNLIWSRMDGRYRKFYLKVAKASIRIRAKHLLTYDVNHEAKQFLMLPLIALIGEMWCTDNSKDHENTLAFIKDLASKNPKEMYDFYSAIMAQPESRTDAVKRLLYPFLEKRDEAREATQKLFRGPGGVRDIINNTP